MCGIAGLVMKQGAVDFLQESIQKMTDLVAHRGPDGEGVYLHKNLALGHRRLAILDLSTEGRQPMHYAQGELVITYNGEIYNYLEIRKELEALGYFFDSKTDTEVVLKAYAHWGADCVSRFNGMWAFALLDKKRNRLFCSRDRFGVKPFYYLNNGSCFAFGSELRQLLFLKDSITANQEVVLDFILTSICDHGQETFYRDLLKLPAGHNLDFCLATNQLKIERFYELRQNTQWSQSGSKEAVERYMALLEDAVRLRLRADVPVGTCLSGGLDSSTIATLAAPAYQASSGQAFYGITAVSEQESNNELVYAKEVIAHAKMRGLEVKPSYADFVDSLPALVCAQEEPFGSTSLTMQYFVMKAARQEGIPVLLDGQGGDETLLGYEKYYASYLLSVLRQEGFLAFAKALQASNKNNKKLSVFNTMKYLLGSSVAWARFLYYRQKHAYLAALPALPEHLRQYSKANWNSFDLQKFEIESTNLPVLLRYEDKNSMAHSIETRLPFLDYRLVELALSLHGGHKIKDGWSKWLLRQGMKGRMPESVVWRKNKFGFEAPEQLWQKQHGPCMQACVEQSPLLRAMTQERLKTDYPHLDARSQWRLYSIALWEQAFGVSA
jgi:asparagine synthase (glutamine-hydrolysing)